MPKFRHHIFLANTKIAPIEKNKNEPKKGIWMFGIKDNATKIVIKKYFVCFMIKYIKGVQITTTIKSRKNHSGTFNGNAETSIIFSPEGEIGTNNSPLYSQKQDRMFLKVKFISTPYVDSGKIPLKAYLTKPINISGRFHIINGMSSVNTLFFNF